MLRQIIRGYCYVIIVFFALSTFKQCVSDAHAADPGPVWYSAFGKHCGRTPLVKCDLGVAQADCDRVQEAVALINNDTGTQLLQFGGLIDLASPNAIQEVQDQDVIFVTQAGKRQQAAQCATKMGCVHAMTVWNREDNSPCFHGVHITIVAQPPELSDGVRFHVIVHEFLHALGLNHNPFPVHDSFINQYAPRLVNTRAQHLNDLDKIRLCLLYDCSPRYFFEGR